MRRLSIRATFMIWYGGVTAFALLSLGVGTYFFLVDELREELQHDVEAKADAVAAAIRESIATATQPEESSVRSSVSQTLARCFACTTRRWSVVVFDSERNIVFRRGELPEDLSVEKVFRSRTKHYSCKLDRNCNHFVAVVRHVPPFHLLVGIVQDVRPEFLTDLLQVLLWVTPLAICVAWAGGYVISRRVLNPVHDIAAAVKEIRSHDLNRRLPENGLPEETRVLTSAFNELLEKLHASFARIRQFSVNASHELQTPLTAMRGELEVALRSERSPEEYRTLIADTIEEIARLSQIIKDLLLLAQADNDNLRFERRIIYLHDLLEDIVDQASVLAEEKGLSLEYQFVDRPCVEGNPSLLKQVFLNLLSNAVKYTPSGGSIVVQLAVKENFVNVKVRDTGIGIEPDVLTRVFDRFYRADQGVSEGVGLGLSIARAIVEAHGGSIYVESSRGAGSVFTVRLPFVSDAGR